MVVHSEQTKALELYEKVCKNYEYCHLIIPKKSKNILKYNQGKKSLKVPFITQDHTKLLLEVISLCEKPPENPAYAMWMFLTHTMFIW